MGALQRYILRSTATAFLATLAGVTGVVWVSQSLRDFDLITTKGQSFWTFLGITLLAVPWFSLIVAPLALFGAVVYVLNRLNSDSELSAMSAAGVTPGILLRPFLVLTLLISLAVGALSTSAIPATLRLVRELLTEIRADVVVNVLREGQFTQLDQNLTFHVRRREAGAVLIGILIEDNRNDQENIVYTAERGQILRTDEGTYLLLENGVMQRKRADEPDASIVTFERYAFDLSPLTERALTIAYRPRERYIFDLWQSSGEDSRESRRARSEMHDRLVNPLYPLAFMSIAFAALARPRTTRQSRFTGIVIAVIAIFAVRLAGLGFVNLIDTTEWAVPLLYAVPLLVTAGALAFGLGWHRHLAGLIPSRLRLAPG